MAQIGTDCDGVKYSFTEDARLMVADHRGVDPLDLPEPKVWDFMALQWGMDQREFWDLWFKWVERGLGWLHLPPVPGTVEGLTSLRDAGHKIHIMTSRKGGEVNTMKWIQKYDIPYDTLFIGKDKTFVKVDVLVDDWERNWYQVSKAGGRCLVWDQPWNAHLDACERVYNWDDVLKAVS